MQMYMMPMPTHEFACCFKGYDIYVDWIYCQSSEILNSPKPSLPLAPPKMVVNTDRVLVEAPKEAKQKIDRPLNHGIIYDGKISQSALPPKTYPKRFSRFLFLSGLKCKL